MMDWPKDIGLLFVSKYRDHPQMNLSTNCLARVQMSGKFGDIYPRNRPLHIATRLIT